MQTHSSFRFELVNNGYMHFCVETYFLTIILDGVGSVDCADTFEATMSGPGYVIWDELVQPCCCQKLLVSSRRFGEFCVLVLSFVLSIHVLVKRRGTHCILKLLCNKQVARG